MGNHKRQINAVECWTPSVQLTNITQVSNQQTLHTKQKTKKKHSHMFRLLSTVIFRKYQNWKTYTALL